MSAWNEFQESVSASADAVNAARAAAEQAKEKARTVSEGLIVSSQVVPGLIHHFMPEEWQEGFKQFLGEKLGEGVDAVREGLRNLISPELQKALPSELQDMLGVETPQASFGSAVPSDDIELDVLAPATGETASETAAQTAETSFVDPDPVSVGGTDFTAEDLDTAPAGDLSSTAPGIAETSFASPEPAAITAGGLGDEAATSAASDAVSGIGSALGDVAGEALGATAEAASLAVPGLDILSAIGLGIGALVELFEPPPPAPPPPPAAVFDAAE